MVRDSLFPDRGSEGRSLPRWLLIKNPHDYGDFCVRGYDGSDGVRTRAGLILLLACSEALNHGVVGIIAQRIA